MEPSHGVTPRALKLGLLSSCLPELLEDQGYESVFFQSADPAFEWRIPTTKAMGFDEFIGTNRFSTVGFEKANFLGWDDEVMLAPSRAWLATHLNGPFIGAYVTVAAHYEYRPLHRHGHMHFADEDPPLGACCAFEMFGRGAVAMHAGRQCVRAESRLLRRPVSVFAGRAAGAGVPRSLRRGQRAA